MKKATTPPCPRFCVKEGRHEQPMFKEPNRKHHLVPYPFGQSSPSEFQRLDECQEINIGRKQEKQRKRRLKTASPEAAHAACFSLCTAFEIFESSMPACTILVLALLARVLDFALPWLSGVPILVLDGISGFPEALCSILQAVNGPDSLTKGKDTRVRCPSCINVVVPLGQAVPSEDLEDYLGGYTRIGYAKKKRWFWLPLLCRAVMIAPSLPARTALKIMEASPLSLPILCGVPKKNLNRPILHVDGAELFSFDPEMLNDFENWSPLIHAELELFFSWLISEKQYIKKWHADMDAFFPSSRNGRFVTKVKTEDTCIKAAALSLFKQWLYFASAITGWITYAEGNESLLHVWRAVLPESAPTLAAQTETPTSNRTYDTPDVFYQFLTECFLPTYRNQIRQGERGDKETMGLVRDMNGTKLIIIPRARCLEAYSNWLTANHIMVFDSHVAHYEAAVQAVLQEAGIPLRHETKNPATWRYQFYDKHCTLTTKLIDCFGLPILQIPKQVQDYLGSLFGWQDDLPTDPTCSEAHPNKGWEAETL